jgi:hypothetical protein
VICLSENSFLCCLTKFLASLFQLTCPYQPGKGLQQVDLSYKIIRLTSLCCANGSNIMSGAERTQILQLVNALGQFVSEVVTLTGCSQEDRLAHSMPERWGFQEFVWLGVSLQVNTGRSGGWPLALIRYTG